MKGISHACRLWVSIALGLAASREAVASSAAGSDATELAEVIVTAQKRTEDIRDVPFSISVLSADTLQQTHVEGLADLSRSVAGLSFSNVGGAGLNKLQLRGISSDSGSPTVAIYLDEVPITMRSVIELGSTEPQFLDLERVEVLRGPQGTLYGASSMGGTIRFVSKQPDLTQVTGEVYSELSHTQHGGFNYKESGVVNLPLIDNVAALRLDAAYIADGGYVDHVNSQGTVTDRGVNNEDTTVFRAVLKVVPTDAIAVAASLIVQRLHADDSSVYDLSLPQLEEAKLVAEPRTDRLIVPSITAWFDYNFAALTSVTSYVQRNVDRVEDGTYYNSVYIAQAAATDPATTAAFPNVNPAPIANLGSPAYIIPHQSQWAQELRLASKPAEEAHVPYAWLAGLYISDQKLSYVTNEYIPGINNLVTALYGTNPVNVPFFGVSLAGDQVFAGADNYRERQYSVFGEFSYNFLPNLKAAVGARYSIAQESLDSINGMEFFDIGIPGEISSSKSYHSTTPRVSLTYDLSAKSTAYVTASKGFRLGAPNLPVASFCSADLANLGVSSEPANYASDTLWNYEVGTKTLAFDNRVSANIAAYFIRWNNVQQHIYLPTCGFDYIDNAGNANSYGTEIELRGKVTRDFTLLVSGGYTHATLTEVQPGSGAHVGSWLLGTPAWSFNVGTDYAHQFGDDLNAFLHAVWQTTGRSYGAFLATDPDYQRPSYSVLNGSLGVDVGKVELSLFATNIFDMQKTLQRPSLLSVSEGYTARPRTVGVAMKVDFK